MRLSHFLLLSCIICLFFWTTSADYSVTGMNIPHVDLAKVRDFRLSLHNTERTTKWLTPYAYDSTLEWTASTWAQHLADIHTTSHRRKTTDWYYSYRSIKNRFSDQWVVFEDPDEQNWNLFTENIWWSLYSCNKADCTDDFIKAIKRSRTFFMSEKWKSYQPHYSAIIGNYASIGLGVALSGNKYYLVTHYTAPLTDQKSS